MDVRTSLLATLVALTTLLGAAGPAWSTDPVATAPPRTGVPSLTTEVFEGRPVEVLDPGVRVDALVVVLHQLWSTPSKARAETGLHHRGTAAGWLLVYPSGTGSSWNSGRCCGRARDEQVADTAWLARLVASLRAQYGLTARVPTVMGGTSNGAMETAQFFCRVPGVLQGAFLDAGNQQDDGCGRVARVPALLVTRGVRDRMVPIDGSPWVQALATSLLPDSVLLGAARRGSVCRTSVRFASAGVTSSLESCDGRSIKVVRDQSGHTRVPGPQPGIVDRTALTVAFVHQVVRATQRAAGG